MLTDCTCRGLRRIGEEELCVLCVQVQHMLLELQAATLRDESMSDKKKALICTQLADADKCLVDGSDEHLQLLNVASIVQQVLSGQYG